MSAQARQSRRIAGLLGIAVAAAAVMGFLVSRSGTPPVAAKPTAAPRAASLVGPPATAGYSVADDLATNQVVVFGGIADNQATWLWNGTGWGLATPADSPPGRVDAASAYDPALHLVLLFGGHGPPGTDLSDTWAWGGANWRELNTGAGVSPPSDAVMAWDPAAGQMMLVAGSPAGAGTGTWVWSGSRWTPASGALPFPPSSVSLGLDPLTGQLFAVAVPKDTALTGESARTWAWDGLSWVAAVNDVPGVTAVPGLGWDPFSRRMLLFTTAAPTTHKIDAWERDDNRWRHSSTSGGSILSGVILSSDTSLMLVGVLDTGRGVPTSIGVWTWDVDAWTPA